MTLSMRGYDIDSIARRITDEAIRAGVLDDSALSALQDKAADRILRLARLGGKGDHELKKQVHYAIAAKKGDIGSIYLLANSLIPSATKTELGYTNVNYALTLFKDYVQSHIPWEALSELQRYELINAVTKILAILDEGSFENLIKHPELENINSAEEAVSYYMMLVELVTDFVYYAFNQQQREHILALVQTRLPNLITMGADDPEKAEKNLQILQSSKLATLNPRLYRACLAVLFNSKLNSKAELYEAAREDNALLEALFIHSLAAINRPMGTLSPTANSYLVKAWHLVDPSADQGGYHDTVPDKTPAAVELFCHALSPTGGFQYHQAALALLNTTRFNIDAAFAKAPLLFSHREFFALLQMHPELDSYIPASNVLSFALACAEIDDATWPDIIDGEPEIGFDKVRLQAAAEKLIALKNNPDFLNWFLTHNVKWLSRNSLQLLLDNGFIDINTINNNIALSVAYYKSGVENEPNIPCFTDISVLSELLPDALTNLCAVRGDVTVLVSHHKDLLDKLSDEQRVLIIKTHQRRIVGVKTSSELSPRQYHSALLLGHIRASVLNGENRGFALSEAKAKQFQAHALSALNYLLLLPAEYRHRNMVERDLGKVLGQLHTQTRRKNFAAAKLLAANTFIHRQQLHWFVPAALEALEELSRKEITAQLDPVRYITAMLYWQHDDVDVEDAQAALVLLRKIRKGDKELFADAQNRIASIESWLQAQTTLESAREYVAQYNFAAARALLARVVDSDHSAIAQAAQSIMAEIGHGRYDRFLSPEIQQTKNPQQLTAAIKLMCDADPKQAIEILAEAKVSADKIEQFIVPTWRRLVLEHKFDDKAFVEYWGDVLSKQLSGAMDSSESQPQLQIVLQLMRDTALTPHEKSYDCETADFYSLLNSLQLLIDGGKKETIGQAMTFYSTAAVLGASRRQPMKKSRSAERLSLQPNASADIYRPRSNSH